MRAERVPPTRLEMRFAWKYNSLGAYQHSRMEAVRRAIFSTAYPAAAPVHSAEAAFHQDLSGRSRAPSLSRDEQIVTAAFKCELADGTLPPQRLPEAMGTKKVQKPGHLHGRLDSIPNSERHIQVPRYGPCKPGKMVWFSGIFYPQEPRSGARRKAWQWSQMVR